MQGVIVEFQYADDFDRERIEGIAHEARGRFEGLPGLRQKAFTLDPRNRRATNVYLWDSDEAAREFFTEELVERVTGSLRRASNRHVRRGRRARRQRVGAAASVRRFVVAASVTAAKPFDGFASLLCSVRVAQNASPTGDVTSIPATFLRVTAAV